jgi:glycosyltransferase involved in cell wall biosynthesis
VPLSSFSVMTSTSHTADELPPRLSVVLISRNQLWNISRLIQSVRNECAAIRHELILIDSASGDGTAEAAASHGVRVLQIEPTEHMSPSAGRYLGHRATTGEFVLFLDGDAELVPGWLNIAVGLMESDSAIAGVTGARISLPIDSVPAQRPEPPPLTDEWTTVTHSGGSALYRRAALDVAGTFDPYLYSDEEPDLSIRLRHHGFHLARTTYPAIFDYTDPVDRIGTLWGRRSRRLYLGAGQNLRKHAGEPTFSRYLRERGFGVLPLLGVPSYGAAVVAAASRGRAPLLGMLSLPPLAFALLTIRKGSPYKALHSVMLRALIAEGTVKGLWLPVRDPESYQPRTKEIVAGP